MTYLYLVLLLCTLTNAYRGSDDASVDRGHAPSGHLAAQAVHAGQGKHASNRPDDQSSASDAADKHISGRNAPGPLSSSAVPSDVLNALQELSRRGQLLQRPQLPVHQSYNAYPRHQKLYGLSRSAADDASALDQDSKHGDDDSSVHSAYNNAAYDASYNDAASASRRPGANEGKQLPHPARSNAAHSAGVHDVRRPSASGQGAHNAVVEGSVVDAVRASHVRGNNVNADVPRGSQDSGSDEAGRAGYYLDDADQSPYASPVHSNQDDSRASLYDLTGMGGYGGLGGLSPYGGLSGLSGLNGPIGYPGGMRVYNANPYSGLNQIPGLYGR